MNKKEEFIQSLIDSTKESRATWCNINVTNPVAKVVANQETISQVFSSDIKNKQVYFVIQKCPDYSMELDQYYEKFSNFLLVFDGSNLVYSVYENEVSENMLDKLLDEIRDKLEAAFYEDFMKD